MSVVKHIIGSLGDLGVEIVKETVRAPVAIAEQVVFKSTPSPEKPHPTKEFPELNKKNVEPRRMLQQFVGMSGPPKKEPGTWEQKQMEEKQQKELRDKRKIETEKQTIRPVSTKHKQGQRYGLNVKTNIEKQRDTKAE